MMGEGPLFFAFPAGTLWEYALWKLAYVLIRRVLPEPEPEPEPSERVG